MIYALGDAEPTIDPEAAVHPRAVVIGRVELCCGVTVHAGAVLRGDDDRIVVGAGSVVGSGAVLHVFPFAPTVIGGDCVIGPLAHLEGCIIEDRAEVGARAIVLPGAVVRSGARVVAHTLVPMGMEVPGGREAIGIPATVLS